jgi:hypothetical protein
MIFSSYFLLFFFIFINANELYQLGIINHHTQWNIYCPENNTQIIKPPFKDQPLISYQCPHGSLPIDIVPLEIDLTFVCRVESRLIWIIVDIYQYNDWLWSKNIEPTHISIELNAKLVVNESKSEINNYKNRFIIINAFYIPFESLEILSNEIIDIIIRINQCKFYIRENSTWNDIMHKDCHSIQSKTLQVQYAQCDFIPKFVFQTFLFSLKISFRLIPIDNTTDIPDFHVVLSIDQPQQPIKTTTVAHLPDYYLLFNEHYRNILSTLAILTRASNLITFIFIFIIIILILLIIFFIYTLCYHYHVRSTRKSSLLI